MQDKIVEAVAEDEAINDCIFAMGRALRRGRVNTDQYLRDKLVLTHNVIINYFHLYFFQLEIDLRFAIYLSRRPTLKFKDQLQ